MSDRAHRLARMRDGRTLAYAEHGSPSGRPVIYCHGVPSSRVEGELILNDSVLSELRLRVIVPDRPGIGRSQHQPDRRVVDWPHDVLDLAASLGLETFAVVGSSGGSPYAIACGAFLPDRVVAVGVIGGVAPVDAPGVLASMSGPLRLTIRLARLAPPLLRILFRLNLRAIRGDKARAGRRMAAMAPEPDRILLERPEIRDGFTACFEEACREGQNGAVLDTALIGQPWGFALSAVKVPVLLWHGEQDRNVPVLSGRYLAGALPHCRATFYPHEAHLSVPLNHQQEIFGALAAMAAA